MYLELIRSDLQTESRDVNCSQVRFKDLNDKAQQAVVIVGKGKFIDGKGDRARESYTMIYSPSKN